MPLLLTASLGVVRGFVMPQLLISRTSCMAGALYEKGSGWQACAAILSVILLVLQYIDMEDPKAALAKSLNQTALTQDSALAAMEGISPVLTQGVRAVYACMLHERSKEASDHSLGPSVGLCGACAPNRAQGFWHRSQHCGGCCPT